MNAKSKNILKQAKSPSEIADCFEAYRELRPHLTDQQAFVTQVLQQQKEGFEIHALYQGETIVGCIGFRSMTTFAWGKILYIDDLITRESHRGHGYGSQLLTYAIEKAKSEGYDQVHLDTGYTRHAAHRAYLKHGFELNCHHMALKIT